MVKIFGRRKKEPDPDEQFQQNQALNQGNIMSEEVRASLGQSVYMVHDPYVHEAFRDKDNELLETMLPAFSFLNRTTNIDKAEKELLFWQYKRLMTLTRLTMKERDYNTKWWLQQEALQIYAMGILNDAEGGWKGKLVTEQIRKIITELRKPEKKGRFF